MAKSRDAFRTISEVSEVLDTPAHVLRFWESKFKQIKPVKRAGGRRYYRPDDVSLVAGIKHLLHDQGMTIKGAQKLLREEGVKHVIAIGENLNKPEQTMEQTLKVVPEADATEQAVADIVKAEEATQTEMFAAPETKSDTHTSHEADTNPAPKLRIISAKPVPDPTPEAEPTNAAAVQDTAPSTLSPFSKPAVVLPDNPKPRADMPARCLATAVHAQPDRVAAKAAEIAPLLARLTALRDEMRHPW